jgi:hypothetical protein
MRTLQEKATAEFWGDSRPWLGEARDVSSLSPSRTSSTVDDATAGSPLDRVR